MTVSKHPLAVLGEDMARNHAIAALGLKNAHKVVPGLHRNEDRKVVVVMGAGASKNLHGVPRAAEARSLVKTKLGFHEGRAEELFALQHDRLTKAQQLPEGAFETDLLACSILDRQKTLDALESTFHRLYVPSLGYEVLAHMLKHRFVDAVINFNFDELFDDALSGEIADQDYYRVISPDDCPDEDRWEAGRLDLPIYIKPHGTLSRAETLRFTREDYHQLPQALRLLMARVIDSGATTIFVVGFGLDSPEFLQVLGERVANGGSCRMVTVRWTRSPSSFPLSGIDRRNVYVSEFGDLNRLMVRAWDEATELFDPGLRPRGIARHRLLTAALRRDLSEEEHKAGHAAVRLYLDRARTELVLAIVKARGWVSLPELVQGRPGYYFKLAKAESRTSTGPEPPSLIDSCKALGLQPLSYSPMTLHLRASEYSDDWEACTTAPPEVCTELVDKLRSWLGLPEEVGAEISPLVEEIWNGPEVEIAPHGVSTLEYLCEGGRPIRAYTALSWHTMELLREASGWDVLLGVAESGEWFLNLPSDVQEIVSSKQVGLVVADSGKQGAVVDRLSPALDERRVRQMPWWGHNLHMTVALTAGPSPQVAWGIVFGRRLRSPRIAPVLAFGGEAAWLLDTFAAYWVRALGIRFIGAQHLADARKEISDEFLGGAPLPTGGW